MHITSSSYFFKLIHFGCTKSYCSMWDLVPWPGIEPGPPALRTQSLSDWAIKEVPTFPLYFDFDDPNLHDTQLLGATWGQCCGKNTCLELQCLQHFRQTVNGEGSLPCSLNIAHMPDPWQWNWNGSLTGRWATIHITMGKPGEVS